jgi:flagellar hook-associated protein 3 FlgL
MISRVTENMKYSMILNNLSNLENQSADLMQKISTQKNINKPSDDPVGTNTILNYHSALSSIQQYQNNITDVNSWLNVADTNFSGIKDVLTQAVSIATSQSGTGASAGTMDSSESVLSNLIDQTLSLLNAKSGDSYIFGGSKTDVAPFSETPTGSIGNVTATPVNNFVGTVTSGGTYTGTVNKTYVVKIIDGGTASDLSDAQYQVSADGGATWGTTQTDLSGLVNLGDGITATFTPTVGTHTLTANDSFEVNAIPASTGEATPIVLNGWPTIFNGTVTSSGTYTGTVNRTYEVKIVDPGTQPDLSDAQYQVSVDGGATWGTTQTDLSAPIALGSDGVSMTFTPGVNPLHVNDVFRVNAGAASIGSAAAMPVNNFDGTVTASGTYTGTGNKMYALKIITGGTLAHAAYQISSDGGATWSATQTGLSSSITVGDGINLTFTAGTKDLAANDSFTVNTISTSMAASAATANAFNGTVMSSGPYTGTENKTYAVKIIAGGTLDAATYKVSADGGKTWSAEQSFSAKEVQGQVANTTWSSPITAATTWKAIDGANVQDNTFFVISGTTHNGATVGPFGYNINNAATGTVQDLLNQIDADFGGTATASIDANGKITLTDNTPGTSQMTMNLSTFNQPGGTLSFGAVNATTTKTITLSDGMAMTFTPGTVNLASNDLFTANGYASGYYRGNNDGMTVQIGKDNNFVYNITGAAAFTAANGPTATAVVAGAGAGLTASDTIILTRGATAGSWTLTNNANYPNMVITSQSANTVTIDVNGDGTNDVTLSLAGNWSAGNTASFTITPGTPPTLGTVAVHGPGTVDLLTTLNALKTALQNHDTTAIAAQINDLQVAQNQVLTYQTQGGTMMNSLTVAGNSNTALDTQITDLDSKIETADTDKLITTYQLQQTDLQAAYSMAAKIAQMSILDFLK